MSTANSMKAIVIREQGGPEVMAIEAVPMPELKPGQARIKLEAIGLNFIDIYQRSGQYKIPLPATIGQEAAGIIESVGEGVTEFKVGDRVAYGFSLGSYAEYSVVPAEKLVHVPAGVSSKYAAALMLQGMTAHYLVTDTFAIKPGHTVLVHAAAGGTGQLVVQMAKLRGARVIATCSTEAKAQVVRAAGADTVLLYGNFDEAVQQLTHGKGVDAVYDSVGKDTFERSLNCLRPRGYMVLFGQASGAVPPFDPQILNAKGSLFFTRPSLGHYLQTRAELLGRTDEIFGWVAARQLKAAIDREFPLAEAPSAHIALNSRGTQGKVLLIP
jgi:NADPH2:quinone reductase